MKAKAAKATAVLPRRLAEGDLLLRALSIRDGPHLRRLLAGTPPPPPLWQWLPLWLRVRRTFTPAYVLVLEGRRIGFVGLYELRLGHSGKLSMNLGEYRRRGYGGRAFQLLRRSLAKHGVVRELLAEIQPRNEASLSFLLSVGFEDRGAEGDRRLLGCLLDEP
ncbi:MAG: GNAT family N-acetyltransferase [Proteobacteria bacterium]|nr:GNAT family N-acetyltransferase [Pseudomonadota bacterium]